MTDEVKSSNQFRNLLKGYNMLLYFSGSMIMNEPKDDCLIDFLSDGIMKKLPVTSANPLFIMSAGLLREPCTDKELCREMLVSDYRRLLSAEGTRLAEPRKSAYADCEIINNPAGNVSEFYSSYGWEPGKKGDSIQDDHLGVELLFLTRLIDKYIQLDDEPCIMEMRKEIRRFIGTHLLSWLPRWNTRIQDYARSPYYRGVGNMIQACVEDLYGLFDQRGRPL